MSTPSQVYGCSAFGLKECIADAKLCRSSADMYLADTVLPSTPFGNIRTGKKAKDERIHAGLPWPPEARVRRGDLLRRAPISPVWRALVEAGDVSARSALYP